MPNTISPTFVTSKEPMKIFIKSNFTIYKHFSTTNPIACLAFDWACSCRKTQQKE